MQTQPLISIPLKNGIQSPKAPLVIPDLIGNPASEIPNSDFLCETLSLSPNKVVAISIPPLSGFLPRGEKELTQEEDSLFVSQPSRPYVGESRRAILGT